MVDPVVVPAGTSAATAVAAAGLPATGPKAVVVVRDSTGRLRDLDWTPEADTEVTPVAIDTPAVMNFSGGADVALRLYFSTRSARAPIGV